MEGGVRAAVHYVGSAGSGGSGGVSKSMVLREAVLQKSKKRRAIALAARHPSLTAVSQRLPEINMLKMGAIPGKDYHTGPTAPILSMLISCMSQRLRYGLTAPRDYAYISPKSHISVSYTHLRAHET